MGVRELPVWFSAAGILGFLASSLHLRKPNSPLIITSARRTQIILFSYSFRLQKAFPLGVFSVTNKTAKLLPSC